MTPEQLSQAQALMRRADGLRALRKEVEELTAPSYLVGRQRMNLGPEPSSELLELSPAVWDQCRKAMLEDVDAQIKRAVAEFAAL